MSLSEISSASTPLESPHLRDHDYALSEARWMLNLVKTPTSEISLEARQNISEQTVDNFANHINAGFLEHRKSATLGGEFAFTEWEGQGSLIRDALGREFIDMLGGFGLYSYGLRHPKIVEAVRAQLDRSPQYSQEMLDPLRAQLGRVLAHLTPGDIQKGFFANSGTEAIEGALKLAKFYTGKRGIISMQKGFHGKTLGSLSVTGKSVFREPILPLLEGVRFVPYGCACAVEQELEAAQVVGDGMAAVIIEPVQGEAGAIVPPPDFLPRLREICDYYKVLLIADEVQTGFGRTGKMFGVDHAGIAPDIMCFGKALGGGVVACSAFFATAKIWSVLEPNPFMHTTTTGGNPLACAAALAAVEVMLEEDTPRQAAEKGDYMMVKLNELKARYPDVLKEVSGQGLLIGMRFPSSTVGYKVASGLFQRRVLTAGTLISAESIRIEPALNVPMDLLDEVLNRLEDTLKSVKLEPGDVRPAVQEHSFSKPECYGPCAWGTKCLAKK
ncbi:MAG: putrescine aminotransferase [Chthoniobacterales bacterium]